MGTTKAAGSTGPDLLGGQSFVIALIAVPLMIVATFTGRTIDRSIGERGCTWLFWAVMAGYTVRLGSVSDRGLGGIVWPMELGRWTLRPGRLTA